MNTDWRYALRNQHCTLSLNKSICSNWKKNTFIMIYEKIVRSYTYQTATQDTYSKYTDRMLDQELAGPSPEADWDNTTSQLSQWEFYANSVFSKKSTTVRSLKRRKSRSSCGNRLSSRINTRKYVVITKADTLCSYVNRGPD